MSLTPPLRTPGAVGLLCRRPGDPETGVYIARVYHGSETSVEAFVVSLNLKRRHLNDSQRAMVGNRLANLKQGDNQYKVDAPIGATTSQSDAAELLNISRRSVQRACVVLENGAPELIAAVRDDYATACGLTRSRVGKKCRCTKMDCTTLLVKGTSGHLKHAVGECRSPACFTRQILPVALSKWQTRGENQ